MIDYQKLPFASKWILSRLSNSTRSIIKAMYEYDFATATSTIYSFWQYELCDIFIELAKPAFAGSDEDPVAASVKQATRQALYICLESGLRLLHPFMPFVTEELWQRLPGMAKLQDEEKKPCSLMICKYPSPEESWEDSSVDASMSYMMSIVTKTRSLRSDYGLTREKAALFISVAEVHTKEFLDLILLEIATLTTSSQVTILVKGADKPPKGCGVAVVDEKTTVHVALAGILDAAKEIEKLKKKESENVERIEALKKRTSTETYIQKTPDSVKQADAARLEKLEAELKSIVHHLEDMKQLLD